MLRPERMSRVSVTGAKRVMDDTIETVHELNLLHITEYDGSWEGFEPGASLEGADEVSDELVTVRSLESILGIEAEDAGSSRIVTDETLGAELEDVRQEVNELDDRRNEVEDELREVEERIDQVDPFADLGIDLDLLRGYESLTVAVGEGDPAEVREVLARADGVDAVDVFSGENTVAVFAHPADAPLQDALVDARFTAIEVPEDAEGSPEEYIAELEHRRQQLESRLDAVENELEDLRIEVADFLLAAEEKLSIEAQKREAPLAFATTENAFVAEGWVPTERFVDLAEALQAAVGDHVQIDELERRDYDAEGSAHEESAGVPAEEPVAADGGRAVAGADALETRTDGGDVPMSESEPPVVQNNHPATRPFEMLVSVINRPTYSEFDPTAIVFLTFPLMFGFMIGDLGYGILYMLLGYALYDNYEGGLASLGGIALWCGAFTALFGVLYGEFFGLHQLGQIVWDGHPPMHKGLQPAELAYAQTWLVVSLLVGLVHVTLGYVLGFVRELYHHGSKAAVLEKGSWTALMLGVWVWIFSSHLNRSKPDFLYSVFFGEPFAFGFAGFTEPVGLAGLAVAALGLVLLLAGEGAIGLLESLNVLVNVLSYARIAAVLLAKAGMAFVVNLLFFGAYTHDGEFHFLIDHGPQWAVAEYGTEAVMFPGLIHSGVAGVLFGLVVLVVGHLLVLALGITSAGLQAVRLEYVEFFQKFYEGGGEAYEPFGHERRFTTRD